MAENKLPPELMAKAQKNAGVYMRAMWDAMVQLDALPVSLVVAKGDQLMALRPDWPVEAMPTREQWMAVWPGNQPLGSIKASGEVPQ
jgi:hypothetical protein